MLNHRLLSTWLFFIRTEKRKQDTDLWLSPDLAVVLAAEVVMSVALAVDRLRRRQSS